MIEKLDLIENTDNLYDKNGFITNVACGSATISKVNELIDAVNELQEFADVADKNLAKLMEEATRPENVQSKYEVVITDKEINKYVAFRCSTPHEVLRGIDLAIKKLNNNQEERK